VSLIAFRAHCSRAPAYAAFSASSYSPNGISPVTKNRATLDPKNLGIGFGRFWPKTYVSFLVGKTVTTLEISLVIYVCHLCHYALVMHACILSVYLTSFR